MSSRKIYYRDVPDGGRIKLNDKRFITSRQLEVYRFIQLYMKKFKVAPSIYDIARAMDISKITASLYLVRMADAGFIERPYGSRRFIILKPLLDDRVRPVESKMHRKDEFRKLATNAIARKKLKAGTI